MATKKAAAPADGLQKTPVEGETVTGDGSGKALPPVESTVQAQRPTPEYEAIYTDHNGLEAFATTHEALKGHDYVVGMKDRGIFLHIEFQNGPIKEVGINGVQNEHLLAVLIHRTTILNEQFPCDENVLAIRAMKQAINAFQARTANRQARGVEGQNKL